MKKIKAIVFSYLRGEAHAGFLVVFKNLLGKYAEIEAIVMNLLTAFLTLLGKEEGIPNYLRKSALTAWIAEAGNVVDRYITSIGEQITAATRRYDSQVAEDARKLQIRFKTFGNIERI
ncbi:MAG: hypothetical protein LBT42_04755 [Tannerella sp.]|jgi:hypothetical protein|nr:hypothetical protein [Tannerella sp.]